MLHIEDNRVLFALLWVEVHLIRMPIVPERERLVIERSISEWMSTREWRMACTRSELRTLDSALGRVVENVALLSAINNTLEGLVWDGVLDELQVVANQSIGAARNALQTGRIQSDQRPFVIGGGGGVHRYFVQASGHVMFSVRHSVLPYLSSHVWLPEANNLYARLQTFGVGLSEPLTR